MDMKETALAVAKILLESKAVKFSPSQPFRWASGWLSPIYCDNRVTLSYPKYRTFIRQQLADRITATFGRCDLITGVATAGIPQGVLVAEQLGLPFAYVRAKAKEHGTRSLVEGRAEPGSRTVLIEDLISTGQSSLQAAETLRSEGLDVLCVMSIFTYGFRSISLCSYSDLLEAAVDQGYLSSDALTSLEAWRTHPESWTADSIIP
jgi:orotate phosphoribosyltransferase